MTKFGWTTTPQILWESLTGLPVFIESLRTRSGVQRFLYIAGSSITPSTVSVLPVHGRCHNTSRIGFGCCAEPMTLVSASQSIQRGKICLSDNSSIITLMCVQIRGASLTIVGSINGDDDQIRGAHCLSCRPHPSLRLLQEALRHSGPGDSR
ncbi:hypothetical protein HBI42_226130 [Parastagonospora nodorum]|nr:hypothetical protein HBI47_240290 [Parastagonospora nodorum]KAH6201503.1 hypothetical protein HBI43_218910 [Parastagonospora nodorum]KAH6242957.1 hypothetical protein HBI42_226130 [Parastagonospora nodorum]